MEWLFRLLAYLFPRDPVRQVVEAARQLVANLAEGFQHPETLEALAEDDTYRAYIEAIAKDYEATVHLAIAERACEIAGVRFRPVARPFHTPARPQSLAQLIRRIHALVALCDDIERLAQLRAVQLKREHDADPLGLAAHGSPRGGAAIKSNHELVHAWSSLAEGGGGGALRSSVTEGAGRNAAGSRAPPIFDVSPHPQHASEAQLLRTRPVRALTKSPA